MGLSYRTTPLKGKKMIKIRSFRLAGKYHQFDITQCQDYIKVFSDSNQTTLVLCDGAGSSLYGGTAANIISDLLVKNLHENFEQYLYDFLPNTKRQLAQIIDNELLKTSKKLNIDSRLLATTILAISIDKYGKFIALHLGDGSILWNTNNTANLQTISSPQKGVLTNSTYLTMNCPLFYYLRFYRWTEPETQRINLLSDGMN